MNDKDIQALKALAEAATPGTWELRTHPELPHFVQAKPRASNMPYALEVLGDDYVGFGEAEQRNADAAYIAAANPSAILSLISRIEQAEAALAIRTQFSAKLTAIIGWLEANQPDVFRRGMWDAVNEAEQGSADAASRCRAQGGNTRDKAASPSPTVDLSGLTRYEEYGNESGGGLQEAADGDFVRFDDVQALLAAPARDVGGLTDSTEAWEYSFIHSSAIGHGDSEIGPCLTYNREQAFGVGCFKQRRVFVSEVLATKEAEQDTKGIKEQAEGWLAVCATLDELRFGWRFRGCNGMAGAINTIRSLATSPAPNASHGEVSGWISVKDRLPQSDQHVWASWTGAGNWFHEAKQGLARHVDKLGWQPLQSMGWDWRVTHWMPLPAAPAPSVTDGGEHE